MCTYCPSLYEGMPYSLLESLCAGVPIVATRTTGNDEVVLPGVNGELFAVGDVAQGAAAVEKVVGRFPDLRGGEGHLPPAIH